MEEKESKGGPDYKGDIGVVEGQGSNMYVP